jgi:hypothetical protein
VELVVGPHLLEREQRVIVVPSRLLLLAIAAELVLLLLLELAQVVEHAHSLVQSHTLQLAPVFRLRLCGGSLGGRVHRGGGGGRVL